MSDTIEPNETPPRNAHAPVRRAASIPAEPVEQDPPEERREFFGDAMKEALAPFAGLLERKIQPLLSALEALPMEAERFAEKPIPQGFAGGVLDQPQNDNYDALPAPDPVVHLLPPGAAAPNADGSGGFENLCTRCGDCVRACPANAIQLDVQGLIAGGLPYIVAREQPCVVCTSLACMPACPTGALQQLDRFHLNMGTARVEHGLCLRNNGEDCRLCVEACPITGENGLPRESIEGEAGTLDAIFIHAETGRVRVRKNVCVGCGLCENRCPTDPAAIEVVPVKVRKDPIIA